MLFLTNFNYVLYQSNRKKKVTLLLSFFIFITYTVSVSACNINSFFIHRKNILTALNAPNNSLLQFQNALPSLLVENMTDLKVNTFGMERLNISLLSRDGPVLKNISHFPALDNLKEELNKLNIDQNESLIISSNKIFIFKNSIGNTKKNCGTKVIYFIKQKNSNNKYTENESKITLNQNIILNLILKNPEILNNLSKEFNVPITSSSKNSSIPIINQLLKRDKVYVDQIKLTNVENGAQLSEVVISVDSYKTANTLKDGSALHYLSQFRVSKEPKLVKSTPDYTIGLKSQKKSTNLKLGLALPINKNLKMHIGGKLNSKPNFTEIYLSNKKLVGKNNQVLIRVGKMSPEDFGLLISNQSFNLNNESVISISGYSAINRDCTLCIQNAITSGVAKYSPWLNVRIGGNYLIQNFQNKTEHLTEIIFKKQFKSNNSVMLSIRQNLSKNLSSEFNIIYQIPLGVKVAGLTGSKNSFFEYSSNTASRITNWTRKQNDFIFKNTPNHLRRNWNNYMSFN